MKNQREHVHKKKKTEKTTNGGVQYRRRGSLEGLQLTVKDMSLEPVSGNDVVERLRDKMATVATRYIPCVAFVVHCRRALYTGLNLCQKNSNNRNSAVLMTPQQFFETHVAPLPRVFKEKNQCAMETTAMKHASQELEQLIQRAKAACSRGTHEQVLHTFLGGLREGQSYGLRKWLSRHGQALSVCHDVECILRACAMLDPLQDTTHQLADLIRPMAQKTLHRLVQGIPPEYQAHTTAHPHLPFFHRLEGALRGMSSFDPSDDDIEQVGESKPDSVNNQEMICVDDDDEDVSKHHSNEGKHQSNTASVNNSKEMTDLTDSIPAPPYDKKGLYTAVVQTKMGEVVTVKRSRRLGGC